MPEPPMDISRRGQPVVVTDLGPARIHCENEHAVWVVFDDQRSPVGYRRAQIQRARKAHTMATQIWQHIISGERYAVETNAQGIVIGAAGPLAESEVELAKAGDWVADSTLTEIIKETAGQYRDVTSRVEYN